MIRKYLICLWAFIGAVTLFNSCHYADMIEYSDVPRINFLGSDAKGADSDEPSTLNATVNFGTNVKGDTLKQDTFQVKVRLLGNIESQSLKLSLLAREVGGTPLADIKFLNPYVLKDSAYRAVLKVVIRRPPERDKEYKAELVFDYEHSDFERGIDTLQIYSLTVKDELTLEMCGLTEEKWTDYLESTLGAYSNNKLRFMVMALETSNFSSFIYSWVLPRQAALLREALKKYNEEHPDAPWKDENGNLISFDPQ